MEKYTIVRFNKQKLISILIETQQKLWKSEKIAIIRNREYFYLDWDVAKTVEK